MEVFVDDSDVLIEAEDRAGQQERLRHIVEQSRGHIVDMDHLIRHERDAAYDEQHRTGVLRDFKASVVFHGLCSFSHNGDCPRCEILHRSAPGSTEEKSDDVTDRLKDRLNCFVHNFKCFKW